MLEGSGIGEPAAVEDIEGIEIECLHRLLTVSQFHSIHAIMLVPARKVFGILIDDIEAKSAAVAVEIQLEVAVFAYQFSGVKSHAEDIPR